jgi:hypothetical protein
MDVLTIEGVERHPAAQALLGSSLDAPRPADTSDTYSFNVRGWAMGRDLPVRAFQILDGERIAAEVPPNQPRPDVVEDLDAPPGANTAGFEVLVRAIELEPSFAVDVVAVLDDGTRTRLATISGRRNRMSVPRSPQMNPAMLTTIGRSGSKWLAWLLSCHPSVVGFQPLVFEPRVTTYWTTVLRSLTAPKSYLRQIHTERWEEPRWWLGDGATTLPAPVELDMAEWLGTESVHDLAALCQERTEAFYLEVAKRSGKDRVRYFAEKFLLDPVLLDLTLECFPGAREVILVRDFRDRLSSVFAWNEKRDDHGFGHEAKMTKAQYLTKRVRVDAEGLLDRWRRRGEGAHLVRYEDLILEPRSTLSALFKYLGVDSDPETLDTVLDLAKQPTQLLETHRTVTDPTETIGRWRRDLSPDLAAECNEVLSPVLAAFGYSTDLSAAGRAS